MAFVEIVLLILVGLTVAVGRLDTLLLETVVERVTGVFLNVKVLYCVALMVEVCTPLMSIVITDGAAPSRYVPRLPIHVPVLRFSGSGLTPLLIIATHWLSLLVGA